MTNPLSDKVLDSYIKHFTLRKKEWVATIKDETMLVALTELKELREVSRKEEVDEAKRLKDLHGEVRFVFGFDS